MRVREMFRPTQIGSPVCFYIQHHMTLAEKRLPAQERKVRQQQLRAQWDLLSPDAQEQWAVESIPSPGLCCLPFPHAALASLLCLPACRACPSVVLVCLLCLPVCCLIARLDVGSLIRHWQDLPGKSFATNC